MKSIGIKNIGIDFGSQYSYMMYMTDKDSVPNDYGQNVATNRCRPAPDGYPTVLAYNKAEKAFEIGKQVLSAISDNSHEGYVFSEFKNTPTKNAKLIYTSDGKLENLESKKAAVEYFKILLNSKADGLTDITLEESRNNLSKRDGMLLDISKLEKLCVGYPTLLFDDPATKIKEIIQEAYESVYQKPLSDESLILQPEPYLAALAFITKCNKEDLQSKNEENYILLIDLGGYTIDMIIFKVVNGKPDLGKNMATSVEHFSGKINELIFEKIKNLLKDEEKTDLKDVEKATGIERAKCELFSNANIDGNETVHLHQEFSNIKEGKVTVHLHQEFSNIKEGKVTLYYSQSTKSLDGIDLCSAPSIYNEYILKLSNIIDIIPVEYKESIGKVIFTGGSSRIEPLIRHILYKLKLAEKLEPSFSRCVKAPQVTDLSMPEYINGLKEEKYVLFMEDAQGITRANAVAYGACLVAAHPELAYYPDGGNVGASGNNYVTSAEMRAYAAFADSPFKRLQDQNLTYDDIAEDIKKAPSKNKDDT